MKGRDLIVYILTNHLEDEDIFKDGKILTLITVEEAAIKLGMGTAGVYCLIEQLGVLDSTEINGKTYVYYYDIPGGDYEKKNS